MSPGANGDARREWVLACGGRYWPGGARPIATLPMPRLEPGDGPPGDLAYLVLPGWASDIGVDGRLLAFSDCLAGEEADGPDWARCDWLAVAWHLLTGSAERAHEAEHGPILSYSFRLPAGLHPVFDHAWANRIFLFLRRWAARRRDLPEEAVFGPLPAASILLTHDVDAIALTPEIRLKQAVFHLANSARAAARGRLQAGASRLAHAVRHAAARADLRTLALIREMESAAGLRSVFHFYGGPPGCARRTFRRLLIDPAYDVGCPYLRGEIRALIDGGWEVGLHQSFESWADPSAMQAERRRLEDVAEAPVTRCRQHWLRFSWAATWRAQQEAGLALDTTLAFNDRPGFRGGHALRLHAWDFAADAPMDRLAVMPMLFMDSHFYDYAGLDHPELGHAMRHWLGEVRAVGGEASVNWHTHTITAPYGWRRGFEELLGLLK
jgi:hypothetical protein